MWNICDWVKPHHRPQYPCSVSHDQNLDSVLIWWSPEKRGSPKHPMFQYQNGDLFGSAMLCHTARCAMCLILLLLFLLHLSCCRAEPGLERPNKACGKPVEGWKWMEQAQHIAVKLNTKIWIEWEWINSTQWISTNHQNHIKKAVSKPFPEPLLQQQCFVDEYCATHLWEFFVLQPPGQTLQGQNNC